MKDNDERYIIQPVKVAIDILKALAESKEPMSQAEIATAVGITPNMALRQIKTLGAEMMVDEVGGKWRLGMGAGLLRARLLARKLVERDDLDSQIKELEGGTDA